MTIIFLLLFPLLSFCVSKAAKPGQTSFYSLIRPVIFQKPDKFIIQTGIPFQIGNKKRCRFPRPHQQHGKLHDTEAALYLFRINRNRTRNKKPKTKSSATKSLEVTCPIWAKYRIIITMTIPYMQDLKSRVITSQNCIRFQYNPLKWIHRIKHKGKIHGG